MYQAKHDYPPTVREVADWVDMSIAGAYDAIKKTPGLVQEKKRKGRWKLDVNYRD